MMSAFLGGWIVPHDPFEDPELYSFAQHPLQNVDKVLKLRTGLTHTLILCSKNGIA
jgi:hypothetical protein